MSPMKDQFENSPFGPARYSARPHDNSIWHTWSTAAIIGLTTLLMLGNFAVQIFCYALGGGLFWPVLAGTVCGALLPAYLIARKYQLPLRTDYSLVWPPPVLTVGAALMAVAALAPTSLLAQLSLRLHPPDPTWLSFMADNMPAGKVGIALAFVTVVVAAPLAEELIFRGLLYRLVARKWGPWAAAIISSLIFGIVHGEPWYLFGLIGVGLVLAVVYEATGSVLACGVTHMVHNGISLVMMLTSEQSTDAVAPLTVSDWMIAAGSAVGLLLLGRYLLRVGPPRRPNTNPDH